MVSRRQKFAAIVVIIVVVLASSAIILTSNNLQTSSARAMILVADDIKDGPQWHQDSVGDDNLKEPNTTSIAYSDMWNESVGSATITLMVFNNVTNCHTMFLNWTTHYSQNVTHPSIGDENAYCLSGHDPQTNASTHMLLAFREVNIMAWVSLEINGMTSWLYGSTLHLADLQLQKIDQFLAD